MVARAFSFPLAGTSKVSTLFESSYEVHFKYRSHPTAPLGPGDARDVSRCRMAEPHRDDSPTTPIRGQLHHKRPRGTPTLVIPHRPTKRVPLRQEGTAEGRRLFLPGSQAKAAQWSENEMKSQVEFILFHCSVEAWPTHKQDMFWKNAADFVKKRAKVTQARTSKLSTTCIRPAKC